MNKAQDKDNALCTKTHFEGARKQAQEAFPDNSESVKSQQTQSNMTPSMSRCSGTHVQLNSVCTDTINIKCF